MKPISKIGMGTSFKFTADNPEQILLANGYSLKATIPIIEKSVVFDNPELPESVLETLRPTLPHGYTIHAFETGS